MLPGIRPYSAVFEGISVSAVQDLFELTAGATVAVVLLEVHITQDASETSEQLPLQIRLIPATVTSGSGGAAVTPRKLRRGDASAASTVERNNTTQATSTGTIEILRRMADNVLNGWHYVFTPETAIWLPPSGVLTVSLPTAPGSALTMSGEIVFGEVG